MLNTDFAIATNHTNPPYNHMIFEEYFCGKFLSDEPLSPREYLPVCWTNYYISKNYCNDNMDDVQAYLNDLDRDRKYFTVCQWDDGIVNDIDHLDLYTFASGGVGDYAYPLNCLPPLHTPQKRDKALLCSFIGAINGRHSVRERMKSHLYSRNNVFISERTVLSHFQEIMARSVFALCPRGYGKTSFRICEALQMGIIPVYIYDDPWIPFSDVLPFESYGVLCHVDELGKLYDRLESIALDATKILELLSNGETAYNEYYSYHGCYDNVLKSLDRLGAQNETAH